MKKIYKYIVIIALGCFIASCQSLGKSKNKSLTGWSEEDKEKVGFYTNKAFKSQQVPPGMVLIEGGNFTMGAVQDDVMFDWNTTPVKQQVRSFYLDEAEVTNHEYLFFTTWTKKVFPPSNPNYKHIYHSVLPDTLVWRNVLGQNDLLVENYFRHPAYADYPVVGIDWIQANQYCKWRTDRLNEKILMDAGVLKDIYSNENITVQGKSHFTTEGYLNNPKKLFNSDDAYAVNAEGKKSDTLKKKGFFKKIGKSIGLGKDEFPERHIQASDGILSPKFRLPTEVEWEYAARAVDENRKYNNLRGRKKYTWNNNYTRDKKHGKQLANFKQGKGNYNGIKGWNSDNASITNKVKSYPPNAFGLYDMAGNVSEWVADVYRPIIDTEANDFNYFRGNIFTKKLIGEDGKVVIVDDSSVKYDTLENGKVIPSALPGDIKYIPISRKDAYMRTNYEKSYNVNIADGDLISTKHYSNNVEQGNNGENNGSYRMYNSPVTPKEATGERENAFDSKVRTSLISDKSHVYKGGSWKDLEYWLDPSQRRYLPRHSATNYIGFRCATDHVGSTGKNKRRMYPKNRN